MDTKAMAKSKRSHSQQHSKKFRPNSTSKAPSNAASGVKDQKLTSTKEQIGVKSHQFNGKSSLPGNWDRYEEDHNSESEDVVGVDASRYSDVVKPKSKGADYRYLITEAESRSKSRLDDALDCFASLDDFLPDFYGGLGSILSVRGEGILSSTRDDNFIVDDKTTTNYEAPFLSLNLHTLAEQLEKLDLSERLFVEAELLPPDLRADDSKYSSKHEFNQVPITCTEEADKVDSNCFPEETIFPGELPTLKATFAEAELDMLLSSFAETKLNDSSKSKAKLYDSIDGRLEENSNGMNQKGRYLRKDAKSVFTNDPIDYLLQETSNKKNRKSTLQSKDVKSISMDDSIDDLLADTSTGLNHKGTYLRKDVKSISTNDSIGYLLQETSNKMNQKSTSQSKDVKSISIDDSIDDLLAETSNPGKQYQVSQIQNVKNFSMERSSLISPGYEPKSKVLAEFDSWLDTI